MAAAAQWTRLAKLEQLRSYRGPLLRRDFRLLFLGQAVSQFGDWINRVALVVLVYQLTGRQAVVALVILAELLPRALLLPFGGVLADRYPKRRLMLATDVVRAALAGSLLLVTTVQGLWWLCVAVLLMQGLSALFNPARSAAIPALVPQEQLGIANAINGLSAQLAFFLGPVLGGVILAFWGVEAVFAINAATFLLSALFLWRMRLAEPARAGVQRESVGRDLREGWAIVVHQPVLRLLFGSIFIMAAIAISLNVLLVALLTDHLGRPPETLGLLMTLVGLGTLAGAAPALWGMGRLPVTRLAVIFVVALLLDTVVIGLSGSFLVIAVALFVNGVLSMASELVAETNLQRLVPVDRLGRVFGLIFWVATLGQITGAVSGGVLPLLFGTPGTLLALSGAFACVLVGLLLVNAVAARRGPPVAIVPAVTGPEGWMARAGASRRSVMALALAGPCVCVLGAFIALTAGSSLARSIGEDGQASVALASSPTVLVTSAPTPPALGTAPAVGSIGESSPPADQGLPRVSLFQLSPGNDYEMSVATRTTRSTPAIAVEPEVTPAPPDFVATDWIGTTIPVNLRGGPGTAYVTFGLLPYGTLLAATGEERTVCGVLWRRFILADGRIGWVRDLDVFSTKP